MRGAYIRTGLSTEGNFRLKIDWASLIAGSKFTVFAIFYFVFEGKFPSTSPRRAYIWRGDLTEGSYCVTDLGDLYLEGLIHGGAYFQNFTVRDEWVIIYLLNNISNTNILHILHKSS